MSHSLRAQVSTLVMVALLGATAAQGQTTWYVDDDNCPGPGDGSPANPFCSIQDAIGAASGGDTVLVMPGVYLEHIDFLGKAISVTSAGGSDATVIDGQWSGRAVTFDSGEGPDSVLDGFTVRHGVGTLDPYGRWCGGGIYCYGSSPTVSNNLVKENQALGVMGMPGFGGAIYCLGGGPRITSCTIHGNESSHDGGGVYCEHASSVLSNCVFSHNLTGGSGGGMFAVNPILARSGHTLFDCTFTGNTASSGDGGAIYVNQDEVTLGNCILWGNVAGGEGPEIAVDGADWVTVTVFYCDVQGGEAGVYVAPNGTLNWGDGNIDADPLFVDPNNSDYRLSPGSPCIDAGDNTAVPADGLDLDGDGDTDEPIPFDLDERLRFADRLGTDDTGNADHNFPELPIVDMGVYEYQCTGDLNGDGVINLSDLAELLGHYGTASGAHYQDGDVYPVAGGDGAVNIQDLSELLSVYGTTCP